MSSECVPVRGHHHHFLLIKDYLFETITRIALQQWEDEKKPSKHRRMTSWSSPEETFYDGDYKFNGIAVSIEKSPQQPNKYESMRKIIKNERFVCNWSDSDPLFRFGLWKHLDACCIDLNVNLR